MKKLFFAFAAIATIFAAASCVEDDGLNEVKVQLTLNGDNFAEEGAVVSIANSNGTSTFEGATDASGVATFRVPEGSFTATATLKKFEGEDYAAYTGLEELVVAGDMTVQVKLSKVKTSQIIIKEFYSQGCQKNDNSGYYANDAYVTIYNNSSVEADASDLVFGILQPANAHGINKYYNEAGALIYNDWVPAYSGIWFFTSPVKLAPYQSLTVAIFGAIDHTQTYTNSVDLSKPEYYVMSKEGISQITNSKYQVAATIDKSHYLSAKMFNSGNSWVISSSAPAFFIGKMSLAELTALIDNTAAYDLTGGTNNIGWAPKFPVKNILDCIECWDRANVEKSVLRFPASENVDHAEMTIKYGHTFYRNVDRMLTEALPENAGKLVYDYSRGYVNEEGTINSTDPTGIDAEASIKAGCHIVYSDTNNSNKDFHERTVSALK